MNKYEIEFTRSYYATGEIIIKANSEKEAIEKYNNGDYDHDQASDTHSLQGGEDEFAGITLIKEQNNMECEHNNTITNECSDCNEQELFDDILEHTLTGIMDLLTDTHNVVPDIIDDYQKHGGMQTDDIKIKVEQEIYRRLNNMKGE